VDHLEARIAASLDMPRNLIAYVQIHEFEGLLLSDVAIIAAYFGGAGDRASDQTGSQFARITQGSEPRYDDGAVFGGMNAATWTDFAFLSKDIARPASECASASSGYPGGLPSLFTMAVKA
jgi:hypothetical protein